jgi:serine/threonine-protein kinase HipA
VKEAAEWLARDKGAEQGFSDEQVALRGEDFAEYLAQHGLFVAGSSGVQGEWPKVLLTRADDGLLYLDHTLPDARAREHYIVKFGRGKNEELASILRHEAPYMELAHQLGLRVHAPLVLKERALFIRRFDRAFDNGTVIRFGQESIATLTRMPGFGAVPSHERVCREIIARCTHPEPDILEYIKRDIANLALRNTDNHARNTAVQRDFRGNVRLSPLYDFAPMYMHPDGIARRIRWEVGDAGSPDWQAVVNRVCELAEEARPRARNGRPSGPSAVRREVLVEGLRAMAPALVHIADHGTEVGLEEPVLTHLRLGVLAQAERLQALH